jgi:hypothetical protein
MFDFGDDYHAIYADAEALRPHSRHQRLNAHDVDDPREIVGQDIQCGFRFDVA